MSKETAEHSDVTKTRAEEEPGLIPENICFVVMPSGRDTAEKRWFKGWYEMVINPGVLAARYRPILAAAEEQPGAINDEIRAHLALDPMVVVDIGGMDPEDDPNPNVMYELGIRHALGLPLVLMAWEGQRLPFDVSNQRVIMEQRDFLSINTNIKKLTSFIRAATEGKYYKPMDAVSRMATIEAASASLGEDSILAALVHEIRDLRGKVVSAAFPKHPRVFRQAKPTIKRALREKVFRKELYSHFIACGGSAKQWPRVLKTEASQELLAEVEKWGVDQWKNYVFRRARELSTIDAASAPNQPQLVAKHDPEHSVETPAVVTEELIAQVRAELPGQPWPTGTHRPIRAKLGLSSITYNRIVDELIRRGVFKKQIDGGLIDSD